MDKSHFEHAAYALALLVVGYFLGFAELALGLAIGLMASPTASPGRWPTTALPRWMRRPPSTLDSPYWPTWMLSTSTAEPCASKLIPRRLCGPSLLSTGMHRPKQKPPKRLSLSLLKKTTTMTAETTIHPRLTEIITANAGNKLTEALSTGLAGHAAVFACQRGPGSLRRRARGRAPAKAASTGR